MGLRRSDIQNEINKAHIKIDELTTVIAKRYSRSQKYKSVADTVFKAINYIKILQLDENLTDKEVEIFIQALRETLSLHEIGYQPTTLNFVYNQPALDVTNELVVSGTPSRIPRFNFDGANIENSKLTQTGTSLSLDGTSFILGEPITTSASRNITTAGTSNTIALFIGTSGTLQLSGSKVTTPSPVEFGQTFKFVGESTSIESVKNDPVFSSPSTTAVVTEDAIDTRINNEVSTLNAAIGAATKSAGSGLTETGSTFRLGGAVTTTATLTLGSSISYSVTSASAAINVTANTLASLTGPSGYLLSNTTDFELGGGVLNYDIDRSGSYGARSVTDKTYQDSHIGGLLVTTLLQNPTVDENDHSVVWDNAQSRFTLKLIQGGGGGGGGDADTLDGFDSAQFLRSDDDDISTGKITTELIAKSSTAGRAIARWLVSSDNDYARIEVQRDGASNISGVEFYDPDQTSFTGVKANTFTSTVATGTPPFTVTSTTKVANLNADQLDGYSASVSAANDSVVVRSGTAGITVTSIGGITSTARVVNLNADRLDSLHATAFLRSDTTNTISNDMTFSDGVDLVFGDPVGMTIHHAGDTYFDMTTNSMVIRDGSNNSIARFTQAEAELYYNGAEKLSTTNIGIVVTGSVVATGEGQFFSTSDRRLKDNIVTMSTADALKAVMASYPAFYNYRTSPQKRRVGVIAQELMHVMPSAVTRDEKDDLYYVNYVEIIPYLMAAIKELKYKLDKLQNG